MRGKNKRLKLRGGFTEVPLHTMKRPWKPKPLTKHCRNCKLFSNDICQILSKEPIDKTMARRCKYFVFRSPRIQKAYDRKISKNKKNKKVNHAYNTSPVGMNMRRLAWERDRKCAICKKEISWKDSHAKWAYPYRHDDLECVITVCADCY